MVQWVGAHAALAEALSFLPRMHIRRLTITHNCGYRESNALFWTPQAPAQRLCIIFKLKLFFKNSELSYFLSYNLSIGSITVMSFL